MDYMKLHMRVESFRTLFPRLSKWDEEAKRLVRNGAMPRDEYLKLREENQADVLDEEEEDRRKLEAARQARLAKARNTLKS